MTFSLLNSGDVSTWATNPIAGTPNTAGLDEIVAVTWPGTLPVDAGRLIEARGKIVVPGGIEPHAHIGIPVPEQWTGNPDVITQPPEAASRAAAFGGVTTIIDFAGDLSLKAISGASRDSILKVLERRRDAFLTHSYTDFTFHYILAGEVAPETVGEIDQRYEMVEYAAAIAPAMNAMPARDRLILRLRFEDDLTQSEIATRLGISQMHVSRIIRRSLARLRSVAEAA